MVVVFVVNFKQSPMNIQGGSNMTGTNCDLFTHNQSRSYLNHLVFTKSGNTGKRGRYDKVIPFCMNIFTFAETADTPFSRTCVLHMFTVRCSFK